MYVLCVYVCVVNTELKVRISRTFIGYFRCYTVYVVELLNYYSNYCTYIKFIKFAH